MIIKILAREGIEEVPLELMLSKVGVAESTVSCADDELSMTGVVGNDKAI